MTDEPNADERRQRGPDKMSEVYGPGVQDGPGDFFAITRRLPPASSSPHECHPDECEVAMPSTSATSHLPDDDSPPEHTAPCGRGERTVIH